MATISKTFTIEDEIEQVLINLPGRSFVSLSKDVMVSVTVSSDTQALIDAMIVLTGVGSSVLELNSDITDFLAYENSTFMAEINVPKRLLTSVECSGRGPCVVEKETVAITEDLTFVSSGSGDMFVDMEDSTLRYFTVKNTGSGVMQISTSRFVSQKTNVVNSGIGALYFSAATELLPTEFTCTIEGSGDVYIASMPFNATSVHSIASGSGNINYLPVGVCGQHQVKVSGSGNVFAGSLACEDVIASIDGTGNAIVQASNNLTSNIEGTGELDYVVFTPKNIISANEKSTPLKATNNHFEVFSLLPTPHHEISNVAKVIEPTTMPVTISPAPGSPSTTLPSNSFTLRPPSSADSHTTTIILSVGGVLLVLLALLVFGRKYYQKKRNQYAPLK